MQQVTNAQASLSHVRSAAPLVESGTASRKTYDHAVQFYEHDEYLAGLVADFASQGLAARQPVILIISAEHDTPIREQLALRGVGLSKELASGRLCILDARSTLAKFMDDGMPSPERFRKSVGRVIQRMAEGVPGGVRAYGEMVDLLWREGNGVGALRLEELWNELAETLNFSLLCAYSIKSFHEADHGAALEAICSTHSHVRPTETFIARDEPSRLVEITLLQQRAQALETELLRRERLESQLRQAVENAERAKVAAEQANRAKSQFLAVMSHELRTPLNAIGGYAELLDMGIHGAVSGEQREALERIQRSQRHLLGLINQVLNYTKVETGSLRYEITDVVVEDTLRLAETLVLPQMSAKGLRYLQLGCATHVVRADREKVQQILLNLLVNATKFTDEGGEVTVDCTSDDTQVFIRVRDTGIGIPAEKLGVIFDPFVQVDTNYTRTKDGIGLGLAISRDLARGMKGDLTVESTVGRGSIFTLALPRRVA
jgi:signal transduction histidine kinase